MQADGNLVGMFSDPVFSGFETVFWASGTYGQGSSPYSAALQSDGNFVVLGDGVVLWETGTAGQDGQKLIMQDDRNIPSGPTLRDIVRLF